MSDRYSPGLEGVVAFETAGPVRSGDVRVEPPSPPTSSPPPGPMPGPRSRPRSAPCPAALRTRRPDRAIEVDMEFWAAVVLDLVGVPAPMMPAVFACGRIAGWPAQVLEQRGGRPVRPTARYVGQDTAARG